MKKTLIRRGKLRAFWLDRQPKRGDSRIFFECGHEHVEVEGMIATGAWYFGIGRLAFWWLTGFEKPKNVLDFRNRRRGRA